MRKKMRTVVRDVRFLNEKTTAEIHSTKKSGFYQIEKFVAIDKKYFSLILTHTHTHTHTHKYTLIHRHTQSLSHTHINFRTVGEQFF